MGSHALRLWLPIQQSFDSDLRLHSDRQVLEAEDSRPLPRANQGGLCLRFDELHF